MSEIEPGPAASSTEVVRAVWLAHRRGDIEAMMAGVHPDVVWQSVGGALPRYEGRDGTLKMLDDLKHVLGDYWINFHQFTELTPDAVLAQGEVVLITEQGETPGPSFEAVFLVRDGLVSSMESRDVNAPGS